MNEPQNTPKRFFQSRAYGFAIAMGITIVISVGARLISATATTGGYVVSLLLFALSIVGLFLPAYRRFAQGALIFFCLAVIPVLVLFLNILLTGSVMKAQ